MTGTLHSKDTAQPQPTILSPRSDYPLSHGSVPSEASGYLFCTDKHEYCLLKLFCYFPVASRSLFSRCMVLIINKKSENFYFKLYKFNILPCHNLLSYLKTITRSQVLSMSFKQMSHSPQTKKKKSPFGEEERVTLFPATGFPAQMEFRSTQQNQRECDCRKIRHILCSISRCLMSGLKLTEDPGNLLWEWALVPVFHTEIT